jgi:hypothetical protein
MLKNQLCKKAKQFAFLTAFLELRNSLSRSNSPRSLSDFTLQCLAVTTGLTANKFAVFCWRKIWIATLEYKLAMTEEGTQILRLRLAMTEENKHRCFAFGSE